MILLVYPASTEYTKMCKVSAIWLNFIDMSPEKKREISKAVLAYHTSQNIAFEHTNG